MTRIAISPRLAIRIFLNMVARLRASRSVPVPRSYPSLSGPDREEALAVLDGLAVLHVDVDDLAVVLAVDLVHQLHRFDDAKNVALLGRRTDIDERGGARLGRSVEGAHNRRFHDREFELDVGIGGLGRRGG